MKIKKLLIVIITLLITVSLVYINAFYININTLKVREETIRSEKISQNLQGLTIAFVSDLHYSKRISENIMNELVEKINMFDVDVILFGGDLFEYEIDDLSYDIQNELIDYLKQLNAPYGKYAVLGNHDLYDTGIKEIVERVLYESEFEIITNKSVMIRKNSNEYINLVGIDSLLNGNPDIEAAYSQIRNNAYTIALCHTPDTFESIPYEKTDLMLSGHSHGGQIYMPFINSLFRPIGAKNYFKGKYTQDDTILDITNGIGTTKKDIRLFADAEIVIYKFMSN
ncbi:MAG: metallophosphoesterase [Firmicutes bacterium]|nr:metallophosphoesterase [Bacillota bacterium]MDY3092169.1 metallophosphoesterase [Erysipelotrichaceae bacterium]